MERHLQCISLRWFLKHTCRACDYSHVCSLYQGKWRQVALFPNVTAPLLGHGYRPDLLCVTSSYKLEEAGYLVTNTGLDTETEEEVIITATLEHNQDDPFLHLTCLTRCTRFLKLIM